jgi:hypothetical protein
MRMRRFALFGAAAVVAIALHAAPALAQVARTFVSGQGSDTGTCPISTPCRSFAYAITQTSGNGEITVLDPAGYGAVTINQSISIDNDGGEAGITVTTATDAITIAAGPSAVVNLRGLTLVGSGAAHNGITLTDAGTVNIQNCVIHGFNTGMNLGPTTSNRVNVSDTIVSNNSNGILYFPSGATSTNTIFFERVQALGNQTSGFSIGGDDATGTVRGMAADSAASGNGSSGFAVSSVSGSATATFTIVASKAIGNTDGVSSDATTFNATLVLTGTTIAGNVHGYVISGNSTIDTYQDNHIFDTTNTGTLTMLSDQ